MATTTLFAKATPAGLKDGSTLLNAAGIDPGAADDVWTLAKAAVAGGYAIVKLCADSPVTTTATIALDTAGTATKHLQVYGRTADDSAATKVTLDANGGAFSVFTMTAAYHDFFDVYAFNTDEGAGHHAWSISADADNCTWTRCEASDCYGGWIAASGAFYLLLQDCWGHDLIDDVYYFPSASCQIANSIASDFGGIGFYRIPANGCLAYGGTGDAFNEVLHAYQCSAYDCANGFVGRASTPHLLVNCVTAECAGYGYSMIASGVSAIMSSCADYASTSGRLQSAAGTVYDIGAITLSANPFANVSGDDFRLNYVSGGGDTLRRIEQIFPGGTTTSYPDIGATQALPNRRMRANNVGV